MFDWLKGNIAKKGIKKFCELSQNIYFEYLELCNSFSEVNPKTDKLQTRAIFEQNLLNVDIDLDEQYNEQDDRIIKLPADLKTQLERAFDADLSDVKIHIGPYAENLTRKSNAVAVTKGEDIYFSGGKYAPDTKEGIELLAHEIQHTIQRKNDDRMVYLEDFTDLEHEAHKVEATISNLNLHNIEAPILKQSDTPTISYDSSDNTFDEAAMQFPAEPQTLADFNSRRDTALYKISFENKGKTYYVTKEQRDKAIDQALKKWSEHMQEQIVSETENERGESVLKLLKNIIEG